MVDPAGNVVCVSLATGFTIRGNEKNGWRDNPYGAQVWLAKLQAGFLPYDECPLAPQSSVQMTVPETYLVERNDKPCKGAFDREHACEHIEMAILARREIQRDHNDKFAKAFASNQDKMLDAFQQAVGIAGETAAKGIAPPPPDKAHVLK